MHACTHIPSWCQDINKRWCPEGCIQLEERYTGICSVKTMKAKREHYSTNTQEKQICLQTHPSLERQNHSHLNSFLHSGVSSVKHLYMHRCANTTHLKSTSVYCKQGVKDGWLANYVTEEDPTPSLATCYTDANNILKWVGWSNLI